MTRKTQGDNNNRNKERKTSYKFKAASGSKKNSRGKASSHKGQPKKQAESGSIRLNKYIANAGICSRREADTLIETGAISVNGKKVTELGAKVQPGDKVSYEGQTLSNERKVYLLLNKPKDFITTTDDPQQRKTVLSLVKGACRERIYPVGRLDRMTTGLLLFTNDGEMAKRLTHPKHKVRKLYHVVLDKNFTKKDMIKVIEGVELEDGLVDVDKISYVDAVANKNEVGLELHSGKNRVIRRLFESLGYKVIKLDRVTFAGLTKKNLERGKWRFLTPKEINFLKMIR